MELEPAACYRALRTRDARFDGRFFVGVRSTGVFCRPVCPAPTPMRRNCAFFPCAAAAHEAGFRPCLRCRPEASPGTPAWLGSSATVSRALRLIAEGALDGGGVEQLALRLGLGERHLRRLFERHLGASPLAVARTQRVLFAKRLIDETDLPMSQLALAAGFSSVRRFNAAVRSAYQRTPSELRVRRRTGPPAARGGEIQLKLPFRPPLDWSGLVAFLAPRAIPGVEHVEPQRYRRTIRLGTATGRVEVRPVSGRAHLVARIELSELAALMPAAERLRRVFDLGADPVSIDTHLGDDPLLRRRVRAHPGLRVPGAWDPFEVGVRAILGQQVTVRGATTLARRLVQRLGEELELAATEPDVDAPDRLFPSPARLAEAKLETLGLPAARARAIRAFSAAAAAGRLPLGQALPLDELLEQLRPLPGIGEWTAQYLAMRGLGQPDAFPAGDLGLRRALGNGAGPLSAREVASRAEAWRPWRAYAAMHLWLG